MNETKIRTAITALNENPSDDAAKESLIAQIGTYRVLVRTPNGKIDIDETVQNLAFAIETDETSIEGCLTIAEFFAKPKPVFAADPIDGRALRKGKTVSDPIVDWSQVPDERKRLAGYATMIGELPYFEMKCPSEKVAEELSKPGQLPVPWPRLALKLGDLDAKAKTGDKEARRLVEAVDDRLVFRKEQPVKQWTTSERPETSSRNDRAAVIVPQGTQRYARQMIGDILRGDSELESFLLDFFPLVKMAISNGMTTTAKVTCLFEHASANDVLRVLSDNYPAKYARAAARLSQ